MGSNYKQTAPTPSPGPLRPSSSRHSPEPPPAAPLSRKPRRPHLQLALSIRQAGETAASAACVSTCDWLRSCYRKKQQASELVTLQRNLQSPAIPSPSGGGTSAAGTNCPVVPWPVVPLRPPQPLLANARCRRIIFTL